MIGGRQIEPVGGISAVHEIAVVDAVRVLVEKDENIGRLGNRGEVEELQISGIVLVHSGQRELAGITDQSVHRVRSEEHTSELQSRLHLVCRLLLEKKKQ